MALEFEVKLKDGVTVPAGSAAHQVDVLQRQMRTLQTQMIKANALGNEKAFGKAASAYQKVGAQIEALTPSISKGATETTGFGGALSSLGPYAAAAAAAVVAIVGAVVGLTVAFFGMASSIAKIVEEKRGLRATMGALLEGADNGDKFMDMLDRLSAQLPMTDDELGKMGKKLADIGIRDLPSMEHAMRAATSATAIMGDHSEATTDKVIGLIASFTRAQDAGKGIKDLSKALQGTGVNLDDVAKQMGMTSTELQKLAKSGKDLEKIGDAVQDALIKKGKGALDEFGGSWSTIVKKAHESFENLFEGVGDTQGFKDFMKSFASLLSIFGQTTTTGKAMKTGLTGALGAIFSVAAKVITWIHVGLLKLGVAGIRLYISLFPTLKYFKQLWDQAKQGGHLQKALDGIGIVLGFIGRGVWNLVRPFVWMFGLVMALGAGFVWLVGEIAAFAKNAWKKLKGWYDKASDLAGDFIDGLVDGIEAGAKWVVDAIKGLGTKAMTAFKKTLGIASPSKVFRAFGVNVAQGAAGGIDDGTAQVEEASRGMGAASVGGASAGASGAVSSSRSVTVNVGGITVNGSGGSAMELAEEIVAALNEKLALLQGLGAEV